MNDMAGFRRLPHPRAGRRATHPDDACVAAMISGGDSRLAVDPQTGLNKYLCPPIPAPDLICASSCTASPVAARGFRRAADFHSGLIAHTSPQARTQALERCGHDTRARLVRYYGVAGLAEVILCPSGTDALLTAAMLIGMERPAEPMTAILPQASETGTGVPRAATLRRFDGPAPSDEPLVDCMANAIEIPLRTADGIPRTDDEIVEAYAAAASAVQGRPIVYLTHGTKTGLVAPVLPPRGVDVVVDACQARIEPFKVAAYLRNGWPVAVTGSKFFGGPAFSGAVLFPSARLSKRLRDTVPNRGEAPGLAKIGLDAAAGNLGMLLRWIAALEAIEAFAPLANDMPDRLRIRAASIQEGLSRNASLVPVPGLPVRGPGWSDIPTIFSFAVRDPADRRRLLSSTELRPIYTGLASRGVLIGQPVEFGRFGGLRIAVGARDILPGAAADGDLPRLFATLEEAVRRQAPDWRAVSWHKPD